MRTTHIIYLLKRFRLRMRSNIIKEIIWKWRIQKGAGGCFIHESDYGNPKMGCRIFVCYFVVERICYAVEF